MTQYSEAEVAKHNTPADCWIIINAKVYDVTKFLEEHPGGKKVVLRVAGKDASKEFSKFHNVAAILQKYGPQLEIGEVGTGGAAEKQQPIKQDLQEKKEKPSPFGTGFFGDLVPYADPNWYQGWNSPYYNESHHKFRAAMREIVERDWKPHVEEWEAAKEIPREMLKKAYEAGWLAGFIGPPWPTQYVGTHIAGGIDPKEFNAFHELILQDELSRIGSGGVVGALFGGLSIGLPPILHFGSKYLQDKVCKPCLTGEKIICLAITEPGAGSDVAQLKTEAKKSACGKFYIVNGEKKWITNGIWADFFTVAVRTGGEGMGGVSMILIEKTMPGVKTRRMDCQGAVPSGTTYVTFEDVQVPVENLIGEENKGFKYIMYNFNHERWAVIVEASRFARVCVEEAFTYAHKRKTFGKRLIDHPVIRLKLAHMIRQVEATHAAIENITYQLTTMKRSEANMKIGGAMALLKVQATTTFEFCAREASQIFGGLAYTKGGQGGKVERLYREVRAYSIFAGSEEIMVDLGVRQAMKMYEMAKNFGISSGNSKL